jgi:hypothetical protein
MTFLAAPSGLTLCAPASVKTLQESLDSRTELDRAGRRRDHRTIAAHARKLAAQLLLCARAAIQ